MSWSASLLEVCVYVCVRARVCVFGSCKRACLCGERDRETERDTERDTERETERETARETEREKQTDIRFYAFLRV